MSYETEVNRKVILPFAELYDFELEDGSVVKLTSYHTDLNIALGNYKSCVMKRSTVKRTSSGVSDNSITITIWAKEDLSSYLLSHIITKVKVKITRYFLDTAVMKTLFVGYVSDISVSFNMIVIKVESVFGLSHKNVPVLFYQYQCNNTLFDKRCGLNKKDFKLVIPAGNLVKIDDWTYSSSVIGDYIQNVVKNATYYRFGMLECNNDSRFIVDHSQDTIKIQYPFDFDITQYNCAIYPGCDKICWSENGCAKFANFENFLGFPYIPYKNPVIWGIDVVKNK